MLYYILLWDPKSYASLTKRVSIAGLKSFKIILFYYYSVFSTTTTTTLYPQLYQPIFSSSPPKKKPSYSPISTVFWLFCISKLYLYKSTSNPKPHSWLTELSFT